MSAFHIYGQDRPGRWLVACDHASNRVPVEIGGGALGIGAADMARHIAYDVGAAGLAQALGRVLGAVTGVVVAHRASTVLLADKVALLDTVDGAGTITHIGTHAELLATVPRYRYLLAADDELDDGCPPRPEWEDDDDRDRLDRAYDEACEQRSAVRRPADYAAFEGRNR